MNIMMNLLLIDPISFLIYPAVYLLLFFQAVASPDQNSQIKTKTKQNKKKKKNPDWSISLLDGPFLVVPGY